LASEKAANHSRVSPGAGKSIIERVRPELPPSPATVTSVVKCIGNSFKPLKITGIPVPPPITTTFGFFWFVMSFPFVSQYHDVLYGSYIVCQVVYRNAQSKRQTDVGPQYIQLQQQAVCVLLFYIVAM